MIDVDALLARPLEHEWGAQSAAAKGVASATALERAHALAARLEPSVSGAGGDTRLLKAATELATVLGEDATAIETVLRETFNPRCLPPWPATKLRREAQRAAARQADPAERWQRKREARAEPVYAGGWGTDWDWTAPEQPIEWRCKELGLATSERKINLIAGDPGAGKGPMLDYLHACFALGVPVFGRYAVERHRVGILDFEGARLTARRILSFARGMGYGARDLRDWLFLRDCSPDVAPEEMLAWADERGVLSLGIDSYMSACAMLDIDPNAPEYATLARALGAWGKCVSAVCHARKPSVGKRGEAPALGDVAGSYALAGMGACAWSVWNPDPDDRMLARIGCMRAPEESFATFQIRWTRAGTDAEPVWTVAHEGTATKADTQARDAVLERKRRDSEMTESANTLISLIKHEARTPHSANALGKTTGLDRQKTVPKIMAALTQAGLAHSQTVNGGPQWTLAYTGRVVIEDGKARKA